MKGASLIAPFGLRMPEELKDKIAQRAKDNGRSINAEIVQTLEDSLKDKNLNNSIASLSMALDTFKKVESAMTEALEAKDKHIKSITDLAHVQADYIAALKEILKTKFNFDADVFESFDDFSKKVGK
ncbi:TPA: Arc family DNA-binding protein [Klebsiella pneumoniae]|uniref:Arc family DNA-binding protein n=1 Tax=Klebsiella TaxID=570 RepID=UPI000DE6DFA6|nr:MULTISPECIES: Arc family DNA-binding protein [Klebsiella]MEB6482487.1 Arc family DNA-binding protein [Klebsiella quasipneumoniae]SSL96644.1 Arc-like DNA binding domain protein [Klebsiella variicola]HBQ3999867.1 Arc family DNA-binding protein [Klebsiella pneumoniae]HEH4598660.1 Arc family DNA-binding protein [Klebsiella pneumoniae]